MKFLFCALFFFALQNANSQQPVTIKGRVSYGEDREEVSVFRPVDDHFNVFLADKEQEAVMQNGLFVFQFNLNRSGFVRLQSKSLPKTYFYIEPGDHMEIAFTSDPEGEKRIFYSGKNAAANNLLAERELLNRPEMEEVVYKILSQGKSADKIFDDLLMLLREHTSPLVDLYKAKEITRECLDVFVGETEQALLFWCNLILRTHTDNYSNPDGLDLALPESEVKKTIALVNQRFDPFNKGYIKNTYVFNNALSKSVFIKMGLLEGSSPEEIRWEKYEALFKPLMSNFAAIDYAPEQGQAALVGNTLLTALAFDAMKNKEFAAVYKEYIGLFPESPYVPLIATYLLDDFLIREEITPEVQQNQSLGYYNQAAGSLAFENLDGINEVKEISTLIKQYFPDTPVFVDVWASWCGPCVAEFSYGAELHEFLKAHHIKMLYVSVDNDGFQDKWKKLVSKYQLNGFHYFANKELKDDLGKMFQGIPRYMIFDKAGNLVEENALRPSNGSLLYEQIKEKLKL